ncbi:hypothetical protein MWU65_11585 [Cellulophaga sp. F20128]|uniref:hypothetical protein n=1 Tax=Cellulophaga sp. F20128 TaxID=2926413 RepID=UPI001FF2778D|nr:hypothetical protein [Cellulophaga sp. F20128]MCK0157826.1 hypothetical protein [Cellulophaga sp. F20128]
MESQKDLNDKIRLTTLKIQEEYPELIKYLIEIPRSSQSKAEKGIGSQALKDYLDSLNNLLESYTLKHKNQ